MSVLLDTNVLLRLAEHGSPMHAAALAAVTTLVQEGRPLCIVPQNVYEFWATATRPAGPANGLGLTTP